MKDSELLRKNGDKHEPKENTPYRVTIDRIYEGDGHLRASVSLSFGDFVIHGLKIYDGKQGMFVAMPTRTFINEQGEATYTDLFHPVTAEGRKNMIRDVIGAYEQKLSQTHGDISELAEDPFAEKGHKMALVM